MGLGAEIKRRGIYFLAISVALLVPFFLCAWTGVAFSFENETCLECHGSRDILEMSEEERLEMVIPTPEMWTMKSFNLRFIVI